MPRVLRAGKGVRTQMHNVVKRRFYWDRQKSRSECKGSVARRSEISQDKIVRQKGSERENKLEINNQKVNQTINTTGKYKHWEEESKNIQDLRT